MKQKPEIFKDKRTSLMVGLLVLVTVGVFITLLVTVPQAAPSTATNANAYKIEAGKDWATDKANNLILELPKTTEPQIISIGLDYILVEGKDKIFEKEMPAAFENEQWIFGAAILLRVDPQPGGTYTVMLPENFFNQEVIFGVGMNAIRVTMTASSYVTAYRALDDGSLEKALVITPEQLAVPMTPYWITDSNFHEMTKDQQVGINVMSLENTPKGFIAAYPIEPDIAQAGMVFVIGEYAETPEPETPSAP